MGDEVSSVGHAGGPRLIVLEGIDLSGRTTQVQLLSDWLMAEQYQVTTTAWRTSPLISDVLVRVRTGTPLQPLAYSLLYCADHLDRTQEIIKPALARGEIVIADRYTYTAFARETARGLDATWVRNLYRFAVQPDSVFYLHISPEEAVKRRLALQQQRQGQQESKNGKGDEKGTLESFRSFEDKMYSEYQQMQKEFGFTVIEGDQPIDQVQAVLRRAISVLLIGK